MMSSPDFARFVNENRGMTPRQIAARYGRRIEDIESQLGAMLNGRQ